MKKIIILITLIISTLSLVIITNYMPTSKDNNIKNDIDNNTDNNKKDENKEEPNQEEPSLPPVDEEPVNNEILSIPSKLQKYFNTIDNNIILSNEDIISYNNQIKSKTDSIYDIYQITSIKKDTIKKYITSYKSPTLPKYNGNKKITSSELNKILDNRNLDNIKDQNKIIKGLVVKRSNLRSLPTDVHFYSSSTKTYLDNIQETELLVNTPVLILHTSKDNNWYFVISLTYYGWVKKDTIAYATDEDWEYFINNNQFIVVTDSKIDINNTVLDMSTKLPYLSFDNEKYEVVLPIKGSNNYVAKEVINIPREKAYLGYLPYTKRNIYMQALKYEGTKYQWGGYTGGVDCSSYVSNVFRTFGFQFPRNTSSQNSSVGTIVSLTGKNGSEKLKLIEKYPASLLYQSGHVMLYLGKYQNKDYIIHANGKTLDVSITILNNSSYLNNINKIVLIK